MGELFPHLTLILSQGEFDMKPKMHIENGTIISCELIDSGTLTLKADKLHMEGFLTELPPFYRLKVKIERTKDSENNIELWLPLPENWNGRFLGTGNGGGGGSIYYYQLQFGLKRGFATANTDLGTAPNPDDAQEYPEKQTDFGYQGTHAMTVAAKSIIEQFYGRSASYSYFAGGSTGGQQGLIEAQRYPEDYDGILAGAPGSDRTHLHTQFLWNLQATKTEDGSLMFTMEELEKITAVVVEHYAAVSGSAPGDNFISDPRVFTVDCSVFEEIGLSEQQIEALTKIYSGPVNPRTGKQIFSGIVPGSECHMGGLFLGQNAQVWMSIIGFPFRWTFGKEFDYEKFDFDKDVDELDKKLASVVNANSPDLTNFRNHGGKLLMYTGTTDTQVATFSTIQYYERIIKQEGGLEEAKKFARLYVVPGLGHVQAGPGINDIGQVVSSGEVPLDAEHNILTALMEWVEYGRVPEKIIGTAFNNVDPFSGECHNIKFQRPIYPYPMFPHYIGGDVKNPDSYIPVEHKYLVERDADEEYLSR